MARNRRKSRKRRADLKGAALIVVAVAGLGGILVASVYFSRTRVTRDDFSSCPDRGPRGVVAVVVDRTDVLTPVQRASLQNHLRRIRDEAGARSPLSSRTNSDDPAAGHASLKPLRPHLLFPVQYLII